MQSSLPLIGSISNPKMHLLICFSDFSDVSKEICVEISMKINKKQKVK